MAPPTQSKLARKRPSRLNLAPPSLSDDSGLSSRSMPSSPVALSRPNSTAEQLDTMAPPPSAVSEAVKHLSSTLRGTPRRRPSMPFRPNPAIAASPYPEPLSAASSRTRPPEAFRDPSEHILSGKGSTLQHARSVYSNGPVEILPGLFLGDEHNARDEHTLSALGITTILNVAKETVLEFQHESGSSSASHAAWPHASSRTSPRPSGVHPSALAGDVPPTPNTYFTPPTTAALPSAAGHGAASSPRDAISASILRNTSSTPNLLTQFLNTDAASVREADAVGADAELVSPSDLRTLTAQDVLRYRSLRRTSGSSSDDAYDTASSPSSSHAPSTCTSAATDLTPPALMNLKVNEEADALGYLSQHSSPGYVSDDDLQRSPSPWVTQVELPINATVMRVPANSGQGRLREMRYIKLPWTHDETDLASSHGGLGQGCALIAEALRIDARYWYAPKIAEDPDACLALHDDASLQHVQTSRSPGKILVHCQCGVSRSATLVIAFVMQAAAMRYGFDGARSLLGMHDCYNMVKEKSSSISPNISLIYQLVEWERYLSSAAGRLRDVLGMAGSGSESEAGSQGDVGVAGAGWSTETMDEAMWSKMRLQEEEKEAAEETRRREERLNEAVRLAAERKAAQDQLEGRVPDLAISGGASAGSLMQRRRKKAAPALQLQTAPTMSAPAVKPMPSPGINRRRPPALQLNNSTRAGAGDKGRVAVETPFQTAKTHAWTGHEQDIDGDVMMNDLEPPQTPLRSSAVDSDVVSTPTARTMAAAYGPDSAGRTPNAYAGSAQERSHLSASSRASIDGLVPTTLLSPASPAMATSLSMGSRPNRFSLGGPPMSGSKGRPDSMQSLTPSSSSSTALFGVTALSREERKKQHRRTFSSDWPTLQANLASQQGLRRGSLLAAGAGENDAMDV